jgi:predicted enzyme related to lactoylglutathione lyase
MAIPARYVHTNLIAADWQSLAKFYIEMFGCSPVPPERDLTGPEMDAGTGIHGAHLKGMHLRLPGPSENGPTLEVFSYSSMQNRPETAVNRPGYGHIAFQVLDVDEARNAVINAGGKPVGEVVTVKLLNGAQITWCYVTDPEGNIIELQSAY